MHLHQFSHGEIVSYGLGIIVVLLTLYFIFCILYWLFSGSGVDAPTRHKIESQMKEQSKDKPSQNKEIQ